MTLKIPDNDDELNGIVMTGDVILTLKIIEIDNDIEDPWQRWRVEWNWTGDVIMTLKMIEIDNDIENPW